MLKIVQYLPYSNNDWSLIRLYFLYEKAKVRACLELGGENSHQTFKTEGSAIEGRAFDELTKIEFDQEV